MVELREFIRNHCVHSKLAEVPLVRRWNHLTIVFIHGYPMTLRGFYVLSTKAIFGPTIKLPGRHWNEVHAETRLLCEGLNLRLEENREAYSVLEGILASTQWNKETFAGNGRKSLLLWIESVEDQVNRLDQPPL